MMMRIAAAKALAGAWSVAALLFTSTGTSAGPVSPEVKRACANDYFAYCSQHPVGSQALRKCMHDVGPRLSKSCVSALIKAGEVSKAEVARRAAMR